MISISSFLYLSKRSRSQKYLISDHTQIFSISGTYQIDKFLISHL
ncbi:hypothetical protein VIBNIPon4_410083 [Vibrio nigripulchritudo POn4]|nr:hypothetical protein VIBNIAM115_270025 [Vibrio nigripulchritudo AM115]CCN65639.1 hypothetical protein VIBNIPon4_410083 [Vibrio nigripulchritudo POn4]CCO51449.1 hypothetical protein VIBNIWn13_1120251 [Vibrio nigripulchritudo Wn13]